MSTILLVEDEIALAQLLIQKLKQNGFDVLHASDGLSALRLHAEHRPDLIILDWIIPMLDGLEVLRRLRQTSTVPVLMLTARCSEADQAAGIELGADDYLTKPFRMDDLLERAHMLLQRAERVQRIVRADREPRTQPAPNRITYKDLTLIADQQLVTLASQPVELLPVEFDLLYLLLRNPGRVFSRAYLLETIWKENAAGGQPVDDAIQHLRQKLGEAGEQIETVLGGGYRLKPG